MRQEKLEYFQKKYESRLNPSGNLGAAGAKSGGAGSGAAGVRWRRQGRTGRVPGMAEAWAGARAWAAAEDRGEDRAGSPKT